MLHIFIIYINLLQTAANKKNTHKIKAKTDKADHRRKLLNLFDSRHDLGYPIKHADARKSQRNTIDDLNNRFVLTRGIFLVVVQFFRIHDVVSTSLEPQLIVNKMLANIKRMKNKGFYPTKNWLR
jgi:hypothetical protein